MKILRKFVTYFYNVNYNNTIEKVSYLFHFDLFQISILDNLGPHDIYVLIYKVFSGCFSLFLVQHQYILLFEFHYSHHPYYHMHSLHHLDLNEVHIFEYNMYHCPASRIHQVLDYGCQKKIEDSTFYFIRVFYSEAYCHSDIK